MTFTRRSILRSGGLAGVAGLSGCIGMADWNNQLEALSVRLSNETDETLAARVRLRTDDGETAFDETLTAEPDRHASRETDLTGTEYDVSAHVDGRQVYEERWSWSGCETDSVIVTLYSLSDDESSRAGSVTNQCHDD